MQISIQQFDETAPVNLTTNLTNPPGTTVLTLLQDNFHHIRVHWLYLASDDTIDHVVQFSTGGTFMYEVVVPAGAGHGSVPVVDALLPLKNLTGFDQMVLQFGQDLSFNVTVAVQSGHNLQINGQAFIVPSVRQP